MADQFKARTLKRKNVKGLALSSTPKPAAKPSEGDAQIPGAIGNTDSTRTDTLEIGLEFKLDLRSEDLVTIKELGAGNGGTVSKVMHATTKVVMARKVRFSPFPIPFPCSMGHVRRPHILHLAINISSIADQVVART